MLVQPPVRSAVPADIKPERVQEPVNKAEPARKPKPERPLVQLMVSLGAMALGPTAAHAPARLHGELAVTTVHALTVHGAPVKKQRKLLWNRSAVLAVIKPEQPPVLQTVSLGVIAVGVLVAKQQKLLCRRSAVLADIKPEQPPVLLTANLGATPVGRLVPKQRKRR